MQTDESWRRKDLMTYCSISKIATRRRTPRSLTTSLSNRNSDKVARVSSSFGARIRLVVCQPHTDDESEEGQREAGGTRQRRQRGLLPPIQIQHTLCTSCNALRQNAAAPHNGLWCNPCCYLACEDSAVQGPVRLQCRYKDGWVLQLQGQGEPAHR